MSQIEPNTGASLDEEVIEGPFYEAAKKVYPRRVNGFFRQVNWAVLVLALSLYYLLPCVRWDRGPDQPSQATP